MSVQAARRKSAQPRPHTCHAAGRLPHFPSEYHRAIKRRLHVPAMQQMPVGMASYNMLACDP